MFNIGDKVKPSTYCRPLVGDPEVLVIKDIAGDMYLTTTYSNIWFKDIELIAIKPKPRVFSLEELKQYAFWAVQYAAKLEKENPNKIVHKSQIDEYLDFEME